MVYNLPTSMFQHSFIMPIVSLFFLRIDNKCCVSDPAALFSALVASLEGHIDSVPVGGCELASAMLSLGITYMHMESVLL